MKKMLIACISAVAINQGSLDDDSTATRMILSGIPLEEPYLQNRLFVLVNEERKSLREGKLHVDDCFYLMGTADPTGKLERDEVCIVLYVLSFRHMFLSCYMNQFKHILSH